MQEADWLDSLEELGGRLVPAAKNFVDSQRPPLPGTGAKGIRWLAEQLEDFVDRETNPPEDDRFVEGAGALLGLLLIDHLGGTAREREGSHRVQLGRFGFFDPFGAIEEILDAEDPRACFAEYLGIAEREANANGPVSRTVRVFADALGRARPDLGIESQFELTVELNNGASVDLRRLERIAREVGDGEAATEAARKIISMLPGSNDREDTDWQEAAPRLLPRLVSEKFVASLPSEQDLYLDPIGGDVHLSLQLRYGTRARYVRRAEVDAWMLTETDARARATENLVAKSPELRIERVEEGILRVRQGDGLDGARLLLPNLHARLAKLGPGTWLASAPHRDVLLLAQKMAGEALRRRAQDAARRAPHPVSHAVFAITPDGPRLLRA
jgi:uncharacterized protein YtpQ (UPF0354 family)